MFSPVTIVEVFALLENWKHHEIDRLLLKYALETAAPAPRNSTSARATLLMKYLIDHPEDVGPSGKSLSFELIEELFEREAPTELESRIPNGINSLKRDGFVVDGKKLRRSLPEELQLPKADDELHSLLKTFRFTTPAGHLDQAIQAHTRGDWASANAQLRVFIESLLDIIAEKIAPDQCSTLSSSHQRRELLALLNPPFFLPSLNEWIMGGNNCGFIQGFWKRLHPEGAHPGLSDQEDSTFRLHMVLLVAANLLRRLAQRLSPP